MSPFMRIFDSSSTKNNAQYIMLFSDIKMKSAFPTYESSFHEKLFVVVFINKTFILFLYFIPPNITSMDTKNPCSQF